jgi:hypothetical protein
VNEFWDIVLKFNDRGFRGLLENRGGAGDELKSFKMNNSDNKK